MSCGAGPVTRAPVAFLAAGMALATALATGRAHAFAPDCAPAAVNVRADIRPTTGRTVVLLVRNRGAAACALPRVPTLRFVDRDHRPIPTRRFVPFGFNPGPVMVPVTLPPGGAATLSVVAPDRGTGMACRVAGAVALALPNGATAPAPIVVALCGPPGDAVLLHEAPLNAPAR